MGSQSEYTAHKRLERIAELEAGIAALKADVSAKARKAAEKIATLAAVSIDRNTWSENLTADAIEAMFLQALEEKATKP